MLFAESDGGCSDLFILMWNLIYFQLLCLTKWKRLYIEKRISVSVSVEYWETAAGKARTGCCYFFYHIMRIKNNSNWLLTLDLTQKKSYSFIINIEKPTQINAMQWVVVDSKDSRLFTMFSCRIVPEELIFGLWPATS